MMMKPERLQEIDALIAGWAEGQRETWSRAPAPTAQALIDLRTEVRSLQDALDREYAVAQGMERRGLDVQHEIERLTKLVGEWRSERAAALTAQATLHAAVSRYLDLPDAASLEALREALASQADAVLVWRRKTEAKGIEDVMLEIANGKSPASSKSSAAHGRLVEWIRVMSWNRAAGTW